MRFAYIFSCWSHVSIFSTPHIYQVYAIKLKKILYGINNLSCLFFFKLRYQLLRFYQVSFMLIGNVISHYSIKLLHKCFVVQPYNKVCYYSIFYIKLPYNNVPVWILFLCLYPKVLTYGDTTTYYIDYAYLPVFII